MAMIDPNLVRPNRWRERWSAGSPPCTACAEYKPTTGGWRCFTLCTTRESTPETIEDTSSGHCGSFRYRSTKLPEGVFDEM